MQGIVKLYSPKAKSNIRNILENHLNRYQAVHITDNLLNCLDEFIKNGLKANYKYILIKEELQNLYNQKKFDHSLEEIFQNRKLYNYYTKNHIDLPAISTKIRTALTQEAKLLSLKTKARKEKRTYTQEEKEIIRSCKELLSIRKKLIQSDVKVIVRIEEVWGALEIEVVNNAPILDTDLERIHNKRSEFLKYMQKGEEYLFFINSMDTQDGGAGLGYATVDSSINALGVDPHKAIHIISITNTTILLSLKVSSLKELGNSK